MKNATVIMLVVCLAMTAPTLGTTWTGGAVGDWDDDGNWTAGEPDHGDDVSVTGPASMTSGGDALMEGSAIEWVIHNGAVPSLYDEGDLKVKEAILTVLETGTPAAAGDYVMMQAWWVGTDHQLLADDAILPTGWSLSFVLEDVGGPWPGEPDEGPGTYTLTKVPEPATMSLLALGGLAMLRRRRKR